MNGEMSMAMVDKLRRFEELSERYHRYFDEVGSDDGPMIRGMMKIVAEVDKILKEDCC